MKIVQAVNKVGVWDFITPKQDLNKPLVFIFGDRFKLENESEITNLRKLFPTGHFIFGSTSGEILDERVYDNTITLTAIEFEKSSFKIYNENILNYNKDSKLVGKILSKEIDTKGLKHLFVVSDGSFVNGSELIEKLKSNTNQYVLTGGLCGDGARFEKTLSSYNENPKPGEIVVIAFYGETLEISYSSYGGWIPFGPERIITKSEGNVLFELDNKPALELYKLYLGDKAKDLPESALLFPLSVKINEKEKPLVRTILNIDEKENSMIFAGDVPENATAQLMMANVDDITNGSSKAAKNAMQNRDSIPEFALLVSCVGRKLVMDQRVEEEIEEIKHIIGEEVKIAGFYSYGEIAPFNKGEKCNLHNQTMTLTLFRE